MVQKQYPCDQVVPIDEEPRHQLVINNDFVRAYAVEIAPHDRTLCHHHAHEYLMYVVGDAEIVSAPRDGEPTQHNYHDGDCELSPPGLVHVVENSTDARFRNLLVELLPLPASAPPFSSAVGERMGKNSGHIRARMRFNNERVAAFLLEMQSRSQAKIYGPAIVAAPYESEVELATPRGDARTIKCFTDLAWLEPSSQATISNNGNHRAKVVLITLGR